MTGFYPDVSGLIPGPGETPDVIVEISAAYNQRIIDDVIVATGGGYAVNMIATSSAIKRVQITSLTATIQLNPDGTETIDGVAGAANLTSGQSVTLTPVAGGWISG